VEERLNWRSSVPSYSVQYFRTVEPLPLVVVDHAPPISFQSAPVLGEIVGVPAHSTVATIRSLRPALSFALVPVGSAGVAEVPEAVKACEPER
jgi:hypothetical protein